MTAPQYATAEVHRAIAREDLLTMAVAADEAVSIVGNRVSLAKRSRDDPSLFVIALDHHLNLAQRNRLWSARARGWRSAALIVRFGEMVGLGPACAYTPEEMDDFNLRELASRSGSRLDRDLVAGVVSRHQAARHLRLTGRYEEALPLVMRPRTDLYGTGAEPHMAHYLFERGAVLLAQRQAGQVIDALTEWDEYWEITRARGFSTRYLFDYVRALAYWDSGERDPREALALLDTALDRIRGGVPVPVLTSEGKLGDSADDHGVRELSVVLTKADLLATTATTEAAREEAVALGAWALRIAHRMRGRMRVIARSRAPLAAAFRRLYGDIALLADRLSRAGAPGAAELGLEVALAAKQTGFAARIRAARDLMNPTIMGLLDEIVRIENMPAGPDYATTPEQRAERIDELHVRLAGEASAMLAETVLPEPVELSSLRTTLGPRYALDYLELAGSIEDRPVLFRSLLRPGRPVHFERFDPADDVATFFTQRREHRDLVDGIGRDARPHRRARRPAWRAIADVLPEPLRIELAAPRAEPVPLVISAHSWLSLVPWAALVVGDGDTRLVERALITQTPVLTCLTTAGAPPVTGRALVRLVGPDGAGDHGVHVTSEREAWGLSAVNEGVPLSAGRVPSRRAPVRLESARLTDALTRDAGWAFLHVASHGGPGAEEEAEGGHDGLRQELQIPEQPLTAARALGLHWPTSVLMASCHVGQVVNTKDAEPLNFVTALLTGGAHCVVAGIAAIGDEETGRVARHVVRTLRGGGRRLDEALREAQLDAIGRRADEAGWALLAAYVR